MLSNTTNYAAMMTKPDKCQSENVTVEGHRWWECPILQTTPRLRGAPFFAPLSWSQMAGLVGVIMAARNILGEGKFNLVELGSANGESGAMFCGSGLFNTVWLIDRWPRPEPKALCEYNMRPYTGMAFMVQGDVDLLVKAWETPLDMIYIDAGHSYTDVQKNLNDWAPLVRSGGVISGHDYCESWPGVMQAVVEFAQKNGGLEIQTFDDSSWLVTR